MLNFQFGHQIERVIPQQLGPQGMPGGQQGMPGGSHQQLGPQGMPGGPQGMPGGSHYQIGAYLTGSDVSNHASQTQNASQSQQVRKTGTLVVDNS
jgi:hypothetical protein